MTLAEHTEACEREVELCREYVDGIREMPELRSKYILTLRSTSADPPIGWEKPIEVERVWVSLDGLHWHPRTPNYLRRLNEYTTFQITDEEGHAILEEYKGEWTVKVDYWWMDGQNHISRGCDADELRNIPADVIEALRLIYSPLRVKEALLLEWAEFCAVRSTP